MGGYQIIDLKDYKFESGTGVTITGIHDLLKANRKVVLLQNIVVDNIKYRDLFLSMRSSGADYEAAVYGFTMTITSADLVKFE